MNDEIRKSVYEECDEEVSLVWNILINEKIVRNSIQSKYAAANSATNIERLDFLVLIFEEIFTLYRSLVLNSIEGYYVPSIISTRSLIECVINCKYILEDQTNSRMKSFQNNPFKWTNKSISYRANSIGERSLYKSFYNMTSNYTHLNFVSLAQKIGENNIVYPSPFYMKDKVKNTLNINNAMVISFLRYIVDKFELNLNILSELKINKDVSEMIEFFRYEDIILDRFAEVAEMTPEQKQLMVKEFRSFLNRTKNTVNKSKKKKRR
ncbi:DUF5677 domain-containing protein [Paenibacillus sp. 1781tsa1]|uniref:DUF5677 domain-containing protein n=1 Tax=Paenibacillus sp. 1781tsa1 TaxID=2953810 RepID=UPI00209EF533|nr:DUF5677 domain-containing protein [Paenibacillus sp. 1781tsa1]MCP1185001.1 DUF5677 domain-containing protein [Paenibacillus sp. 1781tsa1]